MQARASSQVLRIRLTPSPASCACCLHPPAETPHLKRKNNVLGNKTLVPYHCCSSQTGHAKSSGILKLARVTLVLPGTAGEKREASPLPFFCSLKKGVVFTVHHHVMRGRVRDTIPLCV